MTSASPKPADKNCTRRQLLQGLLRLGCLGGLVLLGFTLLKRSDKTPPNDLCPYQNLCRDC